MATFDFEKIVNDANLAVFIFAASTGICTYSNQLGNDMIGLKKENNTDFFLPQLFPASSKGKLNSLSADLLKTNKNHNEILITKLNGHTAIVNLGVRHIVSDGSPYIVLMAQDMTFQHKLKREVNMKQAMLRGAYDELLQQNSQLLALDQAKNRFVALVTHELRTPLSAIIAVVDALINNLCDGEEQKKEFINMIHEQALLLQALVNDVLDFAKIQAGKMEYYIEEQNLEDLVTKQVEHYRNMALESKITINYTPDPKQDFRAYFDNLRMTEIINNILSNAIKYNRIGGDITVNLYSQEHHVDFVVTDTGKGIAKDKVPHVFNEFETVGSLNNHHKGTGLGMPICKRLIEAMGGQIYLQSELGKGTTFTVEVPKEKVVSPEHYRQRTTEDWDIAS